MEKGKGSIYCRYIKRILDIFCALAAMIVFCWLYALLAIMVRIKLGRPVIFKQPRPGKDGKIFYLYKFRSMTDERDADGYLLPDEQRVTKFGRWIRGASLDELPEAWNILKGDMSVVGPRPQLVRDMVFMTEAQKHRHDVLPGLTGLAQVSGRNALQWDKKLAADLVYLRKISFGLDCCIVWRTVQQVIFHKHPLEDSDIDNVDFTEDFGDFLRSEGRISQEEYDAGQMKALQILNEEDLVAAK